MCNKLLRLGSVAVVALPVCFGSAAVAQECSGDVNGDGLVNGIDLAFVIANWGNCVSSSRPLPGPVIFGSSAPTRFLVDLASGRDSVDIVLVGDSNTGAALANMWGYHAGLCRTLSDRGYPCFATPVFPAMIDGPTTSVLTWKSISHTFAANGILLNGNIDGQNTPFSAWSPLTPVVRYGATTSMPVSRDSWAFLPPGAVYHQAAGLSLSSDHPLNQLGTSCIYRVRAGRFADSGGGFCARVNFHGPGAPPPVVGAWTPTGGSPPGRSFVYELPFQANGVSEPYASWSQADVAGNGTVGPVAIHSHSMLSRRKGWSVTSHGYFAGYTSTQIADILSGAGRPYLQEHLTELRDRQISAGGSGRVLLVVHSGANGNDDGQSWTTAHRRIWEAYKSAWAALGFPATDLAVISFVSHVANAQDSSGAGGPGNLTAVRIAANLMGLESSDMTVIDVTQLLSFRQLVSGNGTGVSYFQRLNNVPAPGPDVTNHLSGGTVPSSPLARSDGYSVLVNDMVVALLSAAR